MTVKLYYAIFPTIPCCTVCTAINAHNTAIYRIILYCGTVYRYCTATHIVRRQLTSSYEGTWGYQGQGFREEVKRKRRKKKKEGKGGRKKEKDEKEEQKKEGREEIGEEEKSVTGIEEGVKIRKTRKKEEEKKFRGE